MVLVIRGVLTSNGSIDRFPLLDELLEGDRGLIRPPFVVTELYVGMVNGGNFLERRGRF